MQESLDASLVRIRTVDGGVIGAGFLVGERQILTCAHVVSQARGLADHLLDAPQGVVSLDFPLISPRALCTAKVVLWCPLLADGRGDIAGLELEGELPTGAKVVRCAPAEDVWEHAFRAFGFPTGYDDGVWATGRLLGRQATDWLMIEDVKTQGFAVGPGFSGTPVWDTLLQGVVGMVVAASRPADTKAAFVIPLDMLVAAWPLIEPVTLQRVFLSAAPADADFAARLAIDLEVRGIVIWNENSAPVEDPSDHQESVHRAIRAAQAVVLVFSSQTHSSRIVKEHLRLADFYHRGLIIVWVGDGEKPQPYGWQETFWVDASELHYMTALDAIDANLSHRRSISSLLPSLSSSEEGLWEPRNPYKGLRAFAAADARDFFGRDQLIDTLIKGVGEVLTSTQLAANGGRILSVIGPSGSGKSSVVMAGLLPRLRNGALPGSEEWLYLDPIVPGKHPIEALVLTLKAQLPNTSFKTIREDLTDDAARGLHLVVTQLVKRQESRVVLLVDQFEELFTQTESEEERQRFIDLLLTAITEPRGQLLVLLTLRADFYDRPMRYPILYHLIETHLSPVLPMEGEDLRATIEQPAQLYDVQLTFEGNLVGDLLFEIQGEHGALPLLQFALEQLFERRIGHRLTLQAYHEMGGVKGALSKHAEATYEDLPSEEHRRLARALFLRLIDPGASEQETARRRASLSEFTLNDSTQTRLLREVIDDFIAARLLTANEVAGTATIEVSHEALIREWKDLAGWLREAREDIRLQQTISKDVAAWERHGKPRDRLYRGSQLKDARTWTKRNIPSEDEVAFLKASAAHRVRFLVSLMAIILLLIFSLASTGWLVRLFFLQTVTTLNNDGPGSLRQAIITVSSGGTITFDPGLRGTIVLTKEDLNITKSLSIRGPGAGILSISNANSNLGIHILTGASVSIAGLSFKDGKFTHIISNNGALTLTNSAVSDNVVARGNGGGGGIVNEGMLMLINSAISGNMVSGATGGGISNYRGTLTLTNSTISGNTATNNNGGGISNYEGTVTLTNSTVSGNTATNNNGGGISNYEGTVTLTNSTVSGNTATRGGGISNFRGMLTLTGSTISDNSSKKNNGGGVSNDGGTLTLTSSTVSDNASDGGNGGGIFNASFGVISGMMNLTNSTISNNAVSYENGFGGDGGGIFNVSSKATITFCTIYRNTATGNGGGIGIINDSQNKSDRVMVRESIIATNYANRGQDISGNFTSQGYNLIQNVAGAVMNGDSFGKNITGLSPKLDPLRNNGGPTQTHALQTDSPAIDLIPSDVCSSFKVFNDQRGVKRPQGNGCDNGAYE